MRPSNRPGDRSCALPPPAGQTLSNYGRLYDAGFSRAPVADVSVGTSIVAPVAPGAPVAIPLARPGRLLPAYALAAVMSLGVGGLPVAQPTAQTVTATSAQELVDQARQAADAGENQRAVDLFARVVADFPERRDDVLREYADQLSFVGRSDEALPLYDEVLARELDPPERARTLRGQARALLWAGHHDAAMQAWQTLLDADATDDEARANLLEALVALAREAVARGDPARAADLFARAIEVAPAQRTGLLREYADQLAFSGRAHLAVPLYDEAIDSGALGGAELAATRHALAQALLWSGDFTRAVAAWQEILADDPDDTEAHENLALAREGAGIDPEPAPEPDPAPTAEPAEVSPAPPPPPIAAPAAPAAQPSADAETEDLLARAEDLLFGGQATAAVPLYRQAVDSGRLRGDALRDANLGLGRALSWSGDQRAAELAYRAALDLDPNLAEARIGLAQTLTWSDRSADGLREFERALATNPDNRDAIRGAAEAQLYLGRQRLALARLAPLVAQEDAQAISLAARGELWKGRPDLAHPLAQRALAYDPDDHEARRVIAEAERNQRPLSTARFQHSWRSDGQRSDLVGLDWRLSAGFGRSSAVLSHQYSRITPGDSRPGLRLALTELAGQHRVSDDLLVTGSAGMLRIAGGGQPVQYMPLGSVSASLWPQDLLRLDVGIGRTAFDSYDAILNGLYTDALNLDAEFRPRPDLRLALGAELARLSDGNRSIGIDSEVEYRLSPGSEIFIGARHSYVGFSLPDAANVYFNPAERHAVEVTLRASSAPRNDWRLGLDAGLGADWQSGDIAPHWRLGLSAELPLGEAGAIKLDLRHAYADGTASRDTFWQSSVSGAVDLRW